MSDFKPMNECKGFNMERVLLKNKNGYMITAYFKDGMLQCDGDEDWTPPIAWSGFIRLSELANGADASENTLPIDSVNHCALNQIEKVMIEASKCKAKFCMKYVDNEGFTVPVEITENRTDNILGDISVEAIRIDIEHCG